MRLERSTDVKAGGRENLRVDIINAAIECFERDGYEKTSVQEVVGVARVTKGAFYHYFESKEALLFLILDTFMAEQLRDIEAIKREAHPAGDVLRELVKVVMAGVERFGASQRIFYEQQRFLSTGRFELIKEQRDKYERVVVDVLEQGIEEGQFRGVRSPRLLAFGIIGMCGWAFQWFHTGGMSSEEIGAMYADVLLGGLERGDPGPIRQDWSAGPSV